MNFTNDDFTVSDGKKLVTYKWDAERPKGLVLIIHGMSEHAARYDDFGTFLSNNGFLTFALDLRGHGKTAGELENVGQFAMKNGWNKVVNDINEFESYLHKMYEDLPFVLLGHSMGSFLVRNVAYQYPKLADGYILSATAGHPGLIGVVGKSVANINMKLAGKKKRSALMTKLTFGDYNKKYENKRTEKDWLSRDNNIVDRYINDPYCMQIFTTQFYTDLLHGVLSVNDFSNMLKMDKSKPILMFAGDMDPVGDYGKGPKEVAAKLERAGIPDVELTIYPKGRHEMLNEINKEEVYQLVLNWINKKFITEKTEA